MRSAAVWIPADYGAEGENEISRFWKIEREGADVRYRIADDFDSPKYRKIHAAAVQSCFSLGPSRDLGYRLPPEYQTTRNAILSLYNGIDSEAYQNNLFETRITNKLAYSIPNTTVDLTFWHRRNEHYRFVEPQLQTQYFLRPDVYQFSDNELGWQDHLTAKVTYQLPLLPGPIRLFARHLRSADNQHQTVDETGNTYVWTLSAQATMLNEGEIPLYTYRHGE